MDFVPLDVDPPQNLIARIPERALAKGGPGVNDTFNCRLSLHGILAFKVVARKKYRRRDGEEGGG